METLLKAKVWSNRVSWMEARSSSQDVLGFLPPLFRSLFYSSLFFCFVSPFLLAGSSMRLSVSELESLLSAFPSCLTLPLWLSLSVCLLFSFPPLLCPSKVLGCFFLYAPSVPSSLRLFSSFYLFVSLSSPSHSSAYDSGSAPGSGLSYYSFPHPSPSVCGTPVSDIVYFRQPSLSLLSLWLSLLTITYYYSLLLLFPFIWLCRYSLRVSLCQRIICHREVFGRRMSTRLLIGIGEHWHFWDKVAKVWSNRNSRPGTSVGQDMAE